MNSADLMEYGPSAVTCGSENIEKLQNFIITHGGRAHLDDFLACCVALEIWPTVTTIVRRDPSYKELENENIIVIDVGGSYAPDRCNFDHHQDLNLPCALHLVMKYIGENVHVEALESWPWYARIDAFDKYGSYKDRAKYTGMDEESYKTVSFILESPVEQLVLKWFSGCEEIVMGSPLFEFMKKLGSMLIRRLADTIRRKAFLENEVKIYTVGEFIVMEVPPDSSCNEPGFLTDWFVDNKLDNARKPHVQLVAGTRGAVACLYRTCKGQEMLDFSKVQALPGAVFAHKNGFLLQLDYWPDIKELSFILEAARK